MASALRLENIVLNYARGFKVSSYIPWLLIHSVEAVQSMITGAHGHDIPTACPMSLPNASHRHLSGHGLSGASTQCIHARRSPVLEDIAAPVNIDILKF